MSRKQDNFTSFMNTFVYFPLSCFDPCPKVDDDLTTRSLLDKEKIRSDRIPVVKYTVSLSEDDDDTDVTEKS